MARDSAYSTLPADLQNTEGVRLDSARSLIQFQLRSPFDCLLSRSRFHHDRTMTTMMTPMARFIDDFPLQL